MDSWVTYPTKALFEYLKSPVSMHASCSGTHAVQISQACSNSASLVLSDDVKSACKLAFRMDSALVDHPACGLQPLLQSYFTCMMIFVALCHPPHAGLLPDVCRPPASQGATTVHGRGHRPGPRVRSTPSIGSRRHHGHTRPDHARRWDPPPVPCWVGHG